MKIIAFSHTTAPLLAGAKDTTRRYWSERMAKSLHAGDLVQAWDRNPRNHGLSVGIIRLTADPVLAPMGAERNYGEVMATLSHAGLVEYRREGFAWLDKPENRAVRAIAAPKIAAMLPGIKKPYPDSMLDMWDAWNDTDEGAGPEQPVPYVVRFELVELHTSLGPWLAARYGIEAA